MPRTGRGTPRHSQVEARVPASTRTAHAGPASSTQGPGGAHPHRFTVSIYGRPPLLREDYGRMMTLLAPGTSMLKTSSTSLLCIRMQPSDTSRPMLVGSIVPWIP